MALLGYLFVALLAFISLTTAAPTTLETSATFQDDDPRGPPTVKGINRTKDDNERPNRISPSELKLVYIDRDGNQFDPNMFKSIEEEPDFLVPKHLQPGEMQPIRWREDLSLKAIDPEGNPPVDGPDGETFVVGFPPQLHQAFLDYIHHNGMMRFAHQILYKGTPLKIDEQRLYALDDGTKWSAMRHETWKSDMVWLDPADESTFESLIGVLRRGGFDIVLDAIGKAFDLQGLMVHSIGAIFLSRYDETENMHVDIKGSRGSFYTVVVPVHIPEGDAATLMLADKGTKYKRSIKMDQKFGIVLGGESKHGTGTCYYRKREEFRLSFAVYLADINEENVELLTSEYSALWPSEEDADWFMAQKWRVWTKDGETSLQNDKGRKALGVQDYPDDCPSRKNECDVDLHGIRL